MGTKNYRNNAFTLIELMIALSIVVILSTIALIDLRQQIFKGNDARRKGDINRIKVAAEEYEKDTNCYPPAGLMSCSPGTGLKPYLQTIPCDPTTKLSYFYDNDGTACSRWYRLYTVLQYTKDPEAVPYMGPGQKYNYYSGSANAPVPN